MLPILEHGDTVFIKSYKTETLHGAFVEGSYAGKIGLIDSFSKSYEWKAHPDMVNVLIVPSDNFGVEFIIRRPIKEVELISKGDGRQPIMGIHYPICPGRLRQIQECEYDWVVRHTDTSFEGFDNYATFSVYLHLVNDAVARSMLSREVRQDGTINSKKVEKIFYRRGFKLDDKAFDLPVQPPAEINNTFLRQKYVPKINWGEIAHEFRDELRTQPKKLSQPPMISATALNQ